VHSKPTLRRLSLVAALATLGTILLSAAVAAIVSAALKQQTPALWLWLMGGAGIALRLAMNLWRDHLAQRMSAKVRSTLRLDLLRQINLMGPHQISRNGNNAWWAHQYLEQIDALHGYLARYLPAKQTTMIVPLMITVTTLAIDWIAGLLLLLATPIIPMFMVLIGWGTEAVHRTQQEQQASLAANLLDRLQALPWLRRMGALSQSKTSIQTSAEDYRRVSMRVLRVAFLSSATLEFFSALSIGLMAIYIGFALFGLVSFGPAAHITLASGLFILMLAPECFLPLRQLAQAHHDMSAAKASAQTLSDLLSYPPTEGHSKHGPESALDPLEANPNPNIAVSLENVCLQWPDAQAPVLNHIHLEAARGAVIGLAGDSGQGKSTLLNIMAGFIKPSSGKLTRDSRWAWLSQRPHLFHGTVRENLMLGQQANPDDSGQQPTIDDAKLKQVLAQVGLPLPNPLLPAGLDSTIGELNQGVSGGQAQRLAIARAIVSGATLWLLDEPTAALDTDTRDALLDTLISAARERNITIIMASHDLAVLARCDRVLHIQAAQLSEQS
jgi:ATP-binding cassette subfamily C protein CydD